MIPAAFDYVKPDTLAEAVQLLAQNNGVATLLAGGHSLLPAMRLRLSRPAMLVDISGLPGLHGIRENGSDLIIGALTTHRQLEDADVIAVWVPGLQECAAAIGDPQVRNRGTIGGALAHADPAADYPAMLLALGAEIIITGLGGERVVKAAEFFVGPFATALAPGEIITTVRIPSPGPSSGSAYRKLAWQASGFAVVGVGVSLQVAGDTIRSIRVGITGVGPAPYRAAAVESALTGAPATAASVQSAAVHATDNIEVMADERISAEYRRAVTAVYTRRAIAAALSAGFLAPG